MPNPLAEGEQELWSAKPKKAAFIINNIVRMMPVALIWLLFDSFIIYVFISSGAIKEMVLPIIIFFAFHLLPVWIWLGNIITASKKWKNTKYYVTDRRIIIQTGIIGASYDTIYYKDIKNVSLKIGVIDKLLKVGDIYIDTGNTTFTNSGTKKLFMTLLDIEKPYTRLQKIVLDIQSDIEFPNAYRPSENPGYKTKYKG
mgnify:CR=1 FL=1